MMRGGNATIGTWLQFPSADVAEVMGASGYDWVAVDMEHGAFTRAILPDVFRAIERGGSTPFARIAQAELRAGLRRTGACLPHDRIPRAA